MSKEMSEELDRRGERLAPVSAIEHRCRACGEVVATERQYVDRQTGKPWVDPFQGPGVAMFLDHHPLFCDRRPPWWRRPFARFKGYEVTRRGFGLMGGSV